MNLKAIRIETDAVEAGRIPSLFASCGVEYHTLEKVNWPDRNPYLPSATFAVAHNGDSILIHYKVEEDGMKGEFPEDYQNVWEDSCCELFIAPADDGLYYNIECNCLGALYFCVGSGRNARERAPEGALASIGRWTSEGNGPFGVRHGLCRWEAALVVPASALFAHKPSLGGARMKCNVYKCGNTDHPHYVSFFPIETAAPDFHRPEFFGNIDFE